MAAHAEFEEFARARLPHLYRAAWLLCGDRPGAEDLVQEALAKVYVRWVRRLAPPIDNPAAYAQTVLVRTYVSSRRRRSSTEQPRDVLPEQALPGTDHDLRLSVAAALEGLEPLDRAVLVLRYLDDRTVRETAAELGVSEGAVRNRCMRALDRLRAQLGTGLPDLLVPQE